MTGNGRDPWAIKLAAWLHDPAEKAMILLRADHERDGSIARLRESLLPGEVDGRVEQLVRIADHWASAADRPALPVPRDADLQRAYQVRFWGREGGVLIHPLDGTPYHLWDLYTAPADQITGGVLEELIPLLEGLGTEDPRRAFLALWRLAPERAPGGFGALWRLLPADTRIPDHSIWDHLSLTSAFAGAMAGDPGGSPALLLVSLGPVQSFIAQSRSTSDLWAGSHLLSSLAWEAMKVVAERCGPDAVIFPNLWGVPLVDLWLEERGVPFPDKEKGGPAWKQSVSDANPLFQAALPNRFVALVPAAQAGDLAARVREAVRERARDWALQAARRLLQQAGSNEPLSAGLARQVEGQVADFPEVQWAIVPFEGLVRWEVEPARKGIRTTLRETAGLEQALGLFHPPGQAPGFLGSEPWKILREAIEGDGLVYVPNPGALYPAFYELLDRLGAAAKAARPFRQVSEEGYRCTLCGEREWLRGPEDEALRDAPPGRRGKTLWTRVAERRRAWARPGEHLCALCALKRTWPALFSDRVAGALGEKPGRYVVSTHTMALARDLLDASRKSLEVPETLVGRLEQAERVALPLKVHRALSGPPGDAGTLLGKIPSLLDEATEEERPALVETVSRFLGHRPEAYYALLLFDGDRMGAWISGTDERLSLRFEDSWHPDVVRVLRERAAGDGRVARYLETARPASPGRHVSISSALNGFSLHVARWVVEDLFCGKLIYSGGDDVLAMLPVDDVLPCLLVLRGAYSGEVPEGEVRLLADTGEVPGDLPRRIARGHVRLPGDPERLVRMMGHLATASAGVVIAHHQAPLRAVLREARAAERRAKEEGGRNAFSISLVKRAGGATHFTAGFGFGGPGAPANAGAPALGVLLGLRNALATPGVSRRAVYHVLSWLEGVPTGPGEGLSEEDYRELLGRNIAWQLRRQGVRDENSFPPGHAEMLAGRLVDASFRETTRRKTKLDHPRFLAGLLVVAEFLAREGRAVSPGAERPVGAREGEGA